MGFILDDDLDDVEVLESNSPSIKSDAYVYPCLELEGVSCVEEMSYFSSLKSLNENLQIPLFIKFNGVAINVCSVDFDHNLFLSMKSICKNYILTLHKSKDSFVNIDLNDKMSFINAINLGG